MREYRVLQTTGKPTYVTDFIEFTVAMNTLAQLRVDNPAVAYCMTDRDGFVVEGI